MVFDFVCFIFICYVRLMFDINVMLVVVIMSILRGKQVLLVLNILRNEIIDLYKYLYYFKYEYFNISYIIEVLFYQFVQSFIFI